MIKKKHLNEMSLAELEHEAMAWLHIFTSAKGPGTPSNEARAAAEQLYGETMAWLARRRQERDGG